MKFPKQIIIGTLITSIVLSLVKYEAILVCVCVFCSTIFLLKLMGLLNIFIGNIIGGVIGILFTLFFAFIL